MILLAMNNSCKLDYVTPSSEAMELNYEGVLCQSGVSDPLIPEII